ncbi:hypothetical protein ACHAWC_004671 [Mediolabrus comicus]
MMESNNPYQNTFILCNTISISCFTISSVTGNFSQVDKLWSILPSVYAWMCIIDTRTTIMACLTTLWSVRLTYNFYRRGGYDGWPYNIFGGEEDYRWEILRRGTLGGYWTWLTNKYIMVVFNLIFISFYQNWLLLYIASPSLVAWSMAMEQSVDANDADVGVQKFDLSNLNAIDGVATFLFLFALVIESIADNQQYRFQNKKHTLMTTEGFYQGGLFSIVRKPNYAAEQLIWISYYLFSIAATSAASHSQRKMVRMNWSLGGCILLCLLFQGSGWLTEQISISKYPAYRDYQRRVGLYVPKASTLWRLLVRNDKRKGST